MKENKKFEDMTDDEKEKFYDQEEEEERLESLKETTEKERDHWPCDCPSCVEERKRQPFVSTTKPKIPLESRTIVTTKDLHIIELKEERKKKEEIQEKKREQRLKDKEKKMRKPVPDKAEVENE